MDPLVFVGIQTMMIRGGELDGCEFKKMRLVKQETYTVQGCFEVHNVVYDRVSTNIQVRTKHVTMYQCVSVHRQNWPDQKRTSNPRYEHGRLCSLCS